MPKRFWTWYERAAKVDFFGTLVGYVFDWKTWLGSLFAGGAMTPLAAINYNWTPAAVVLAALAAAALTAILVILVRIAILLWKQPVARAGAAMRALSNGGSDVETKRLAGIVIALKERALDYRFRLPLEADDPFLAQYDEVKNSAHHIWADQETGRLRSEFLHWVGMVGSQHQYRGSTAEFKENRAEVANYAALLAERLLGKNQGCLAIKLNTAAQQIDDFEVVCAIMVTSVENLDECLVQLEQFNRSWPQGMPNPLVMRSDGQIRGNRIGRFRLSKGQSKTVPILFRRPRRLNEWYLFDENQNPYCIGAAQTRAILRIYGGGYPITALMEIDIDEKWKSKPSLRIVWDGYTLGG